MRIDSGSYMPCKPSLSFKRKPTSYEFKYYTSAINEGLKVLNKDMGMIIHNSSVPSKASENLGIGSLLSKATENFFVPFLKSHGFTSIQQEPIYLRRASDPSPYDPISTSKNIYMIPLEKLADEKEYNLLDKKDINKILSKNDEKVDYSLIKKNFDSLTLNAYFNLQEKKHMPLLKEFNEFKINNSKSLEPNAIYEILVEKNKEEDWTKWPDEDKFLYTKDEYGNRINSLKKDYETYIDFYMFKQWLVEREIDSTNKKNQEQGIKIIADTPVAFAPAEVWQNQDLFLKDFSLGCPPDYFSADGQRWGFAVINPKKIFNSDRSLAKGGLFLQKRYEEIFKASPGGVRIDHLIGLIDPFVYKKDEPKMNENNSGRLCSSPHKGIFLEYTKYTDKEFAAIFENIIFPAAEKFGVKKENIICEDLGFVTDNVKRVIENLNLTGISLTQFGYSGVDAPPRNVIMLGAHDNKSYIEFTNELFGGASSLGEGRERFIYKTHILGSDTVTPKENVHIYREDLRRDKTKFMAASFAELFTSPAHKVQIFFTDFFGIAKTYNIPGSKKDCWTLRLGSNYENEYYSNLKKGLGINLPEAIARAIRQKGDDFIKQNKRLLRVLDYFTNVLKK